MCVLIEWLAGFVKDVITDINYPLKTLLEKKKNQKRKQSQTYKTIQLQPCCYFKNKMYSVKCKHG